MNYIPSYKKETKSKSYNEQLQEKILRDPSYKEYAKSTAKKKLDSRIKKG